MKYDDHIIVKGETRLRRSALKKVKNYYQEVAWGALSSILDHVVLWWSPEALATRHSHGAQQLKDWLSQFIQKNHGVETNIYTKSNQNLINYVKLNCNISMSSARNGEASIAKSLQCSSLSRHNHRMGSIIQTGLHLGFQLPLESFLHGREFSFLVLINFNSTRFFVSYF